MDIGRGVESSGAAGTPGAYSKAGSQEGELDPGLKLFIDEVLIPTLIEREIRDQECVELEAA